MVRIIIGAFFIFLALYNLVRVNPITNPIGIVAVPLVIGVVLIYFGSKNRKKYEPKKPTDKQVSWYQNIKWWQLLIVSLVGAILWSGGKGGFLWFFLFLFGIIFSARQCLKQEYFKLHPKDKSKVVILYVVGSILITFILQQLSK